MSSPSVSALLKRIAAAGKAYENSQEPGSREDLIDLSHSLVAALEIPSEFIQRSFWSEVSETDTHITYLPSLICSHLLASTGRTYTCNPY